MMYNFDSVLSITIQTLVNFYQCQRNFIYEKKEK